MGSLEEDGIQVEVEDDDRLPINQNPSIVVEQYNTLTDYLVNYGWYLLAVAIVLYFLWNKLKPSLNSWRQSAQLTQHKKFDSSEVERRQLAMEAHRQRLQEEHDRKAAEHAIKVAEREEKKRQEKLEDWERHQAGQGYRSKVKKADDDPTPATVVPKSKKRLRDNDYNPLMGQDRGESSGFRPSRRGPAAGGG